MPSPQRFRVAVFFASLHYLGLVVIVTSLAFFLFHPSELAVRILLAGMGFSVLSWLIAFFKRRSTFCPLCKGTPLLDSGAHTHSRSWRLFPLNYGTTAILSIIVAQRFRCMYCGSDYDLLKHSSRLGHGGGMRSPDDHDEA